jgi:hypothetical protein
MAQDRTQIHYRVDTLLKYYGIKDEEKLLKYLKTIGHTAESQEDQ